MNEMSQDLTREFARQFGKEHVNPLADLLEQLEKLSRFGLLDQLDPSLVARMRKILDAHPTPPAAEVKEPTEWIKVGDAYMEPESEIMYEVSTDKGNSYIGFAMDWGFVPKGADDENTVENKGEVIVKFRVTPPASEPSEQPNTEDAEAGTFLQRIAADYGLDSRNIPQDYIPAILGAMEKYARHTAAKAVADCKRGLVPTLRAILSDNYGLHADKQYEIRPKHRDALEAWLAGEGENV